MGNNAPILEVRDLLKTFGAVVVPRISMLTFRKVRLLVSLVRMVLEKPVLLIW